MNPETMKALEILVTAIASGAAAALGNSRAARRALRKLRARVATLEKGHRELSVRTAASETQHARTRGALAHLAGAVHIVGQQLGLKFGARNRAATAKAP
ncbi:hypothetical protein [Myxococcus sp. RHSTA-1-4]|uniref:hypothetical protein n=1 Tax=Myxococcus sp. RHSTA-1-4 TaxID=2874601 RepID=UPI001CBEC109|nr:hypothetical protein [Myxococcus sp. RHSTA-1-4]MBZ4422026.1 hypothetical protein [Myxococcus sp. RHSTA-1-4]